MFELRHINVNILKRAMYALKGLFVDVDFDCSAEGLFLANYVDSSCRGLMVTLFLKSDCLDHYICDKNTTINMDVPTLISSFKCVGRDAIVSIRVDDQEPTFKLTLEHPLGIKKLEHGRIQMNIPTVPIEIPTVESNVILHLSSAEFVRMCKDISNKGGRSVTISVNTEKVEFSTEYDWGNTTWDFKQNIDCKQPDYHTVIEMAPPELVSLTFSRRYFDYISKVSPPSSRVSVCISKDDVISIEYKVSEMGQMRLYMVSDD